MFITRDDQGTIIALDTESKRPNHEALPDKDTAVVKFIQATLPWTERLDTLAVQLASIEARVTLLEAKL